MKTPSFDSAAKEKVRKAVEDRVRGYGEAMVNLNEEYMRDFFADSEDFLYHDHGSPPIGYDEYMAVLTPFIESGASFPSTEVKSLEVVALEPTVASCSMEYSWTMIDGEGTVVSASGTWVYVLKSFDGVWRVVHSAGMHLYE